MPKIIVQHDGREWTVQLKDGVNVIGRSENAAVSLRDNNLSREHCEIVVLKGVSTLLDKESRNGTFVNGAEIHQKTLQKGDRISVGNAVVWFEEKTGDATPPPRKSAPEIGEDAETMRRKPDTSVRKVEGAQKATRGTKNPAALIRDYSAWGKAGISLSRALPLAGILVLVAVVAFFAVKLTRRGPVAVEDPDNLIKTNASFELAGEDDLPIGWHLRAGPKTRFGVDKGHAHAGAQCLAIDKSSEASDLLVECEYGEEIAVGAGQNLEASVWMRCDSFAGWSAVKFTWLAKAKGNAILETYSAARGKAGDWTQIVENFAPPAGASACRFSIVAFGRAGRVLYDDARVAAKPGAGAPAPVKLGPDAVSLSPNGAIQLDVSGKRVLTGAHLRLETQRYGSLPQILTRPESVKAGEGRVEVKGRMINPVDFKEVDYEMIIERENDGTVLSWSIANKGLKEVDRVTFVSYHPRSDRSAGPPDNERPVSRIAFGVDDLNVVLEYSPLVTIQADFGKIQSRLRHIFKREDSDADRFTAGIRIRSVSGEKLLELLDPERRATKARSEEKFGEALAALRDLVAGIKEPEKIARVEEKIRELEDLERKEWNDARAAVFRAEVSRRGEEVNAAQEAISRYLQRWAGDAYARKADDLGKEMADAVAKSGGGRDLERARRMLDRAKEYRDLGKQTLAVEFLQMLVARYPGTDVATEALDVLKKIQQGGQ